MTNYPDEEWNKSMIPPTETKLLPCPFCGAMPVKFDTDYVITHLDGCMFRKGEQWLIGERHLTAWNTRAISPETKELEKDKERLDWLDNQNYFESVGYFIFQRRADKPLRTAIDNTMKKPQYVQ